jgi:hypothetical protein
MTTTSTWTRQPPNGSRHVTPTEYAQTRRLSSPRLLRSWIARGVALDGNIDRLDAGTGAGLDAGGDLLARAREEARPASAPDAQRDEFVDQRECGLVSAGLQRGHRRPCARGLRCGERKRGARAARPGPVAHRKGKAAVDSLALH